MKVKIVSLVLLFLAGLSRVSAQEIECMTDKRDYIVGDRIELSFKIPLQEGDIQDVIVGREDSDTLELQQTVIDTIVENGKKYLNYRQYYMSFVNGEHDLTGCVNIRSFGKNGEKLYKLSPLTITVSDYPTDSTKTEIKDIKNVLDEPFSFKEVLPVVYIILIVVAVALAGWFAFRYAKNHRKPKPKDVPVQRKEYVAPHIKALNALEELKKERLCEQKMQKRHYSELTEILWTYLQERFAINACEMTTEDILNAMSREKDIMKESVDTACKIFRTADLVKFAKYHTDSFTDEDTMSLARDFVNSTKQEEITNTVQQ